MEPLLSICIPIYNRSYYLEKMLDRFLEDKDLFMEEVYLYISDNCSEEDLGSIVNAYIERGLNVHYNRNKDNIGGDRNIYACFQAGLGKYTWVLGSDDIIVRGYIRGLLPVLEQSSYGMINLDCTKTSGMDVYSDAQSFLRAAHIRMTSISNVIVASSFIPCLDLSPYVMTGMSQVLLYTKAASSSQANLRYYHSFIEDDHDKKCSFDPFQVFGTNLLKMFKVAQLNGWINQRTYRHIKRCAFRYPLLGNIFTLLILRSNKDIKCDRKAAWKMLWKNFSYCPYTYLFLGVKLLVSIWNVIFDKTLGLTWLRIKPINVFEDFDRR